MQIGQWILGKNSEENSVSVEDNYRRGERLRSSMGRFYGTSFLVRFRKLQQRKSSYRKTGKSHLRW